MNREIRFGLVGYGTPHETSASGRGGNVFGLAVQNIEGVVPVAICDTNPLSLESAAKVYPAAAIFDNFDAMLEKVKMDALFIGTPATCHAEFGIKALAKDIHVLSEIPTVASIEEAQGLWDAHKRSKALYMTGANPNFWAFIDAAVDLKEKGLLGDPFYIEAEYIHDIRSYFERTPWRATYEPIRYCTHSLGPMLRLIEEDLEWASCFDTGSHINKQAGQHDVMAALFRTRSNVVVRLLVSFINEVSLAYHQYRVFTTKGTFERTAPHWTSTGVVPPKSQRTLFYSKDLPSSKNRLELPVAEMPPAYADNPKAAGHGGADYAMLEAFFRAIRDGGPSPISLREGLRMTLPGLYAAESARKGGELVRIRYPWSEK